MHLRTLSPEEAHIIRDKGTEPPFSGVFDSHKETGIYTCKQCHTYLYRSEDKFDAGCGWPSFDDAITGAVEEVLDSDGIRTEITCRFCQGHLGHVFRGEGMTSLDTRFCVNSLSLDFISAQDVEHQKILYLGGGCFWCIEAVMQLIPGIEQVTPGYAGGALPHPTYDAVCGGETGHAEVVRIVYDPTEVSLTRILEVFFESHDPTTLNRQGNDIGTQYRSVIYLDSQDAYEKTVFFVDHKIRPQYRDPVVTEIMLLQDTPTGIFSPAEIDHHNYFKNHPERAYCQIVIAPKVEKVGKLTKEL
jgi:peptide methionine sulfoxide reductase msrA/msrB